MADRHGKVTYGVYAHHQHCQGNTRFDSSSVRCAGGPTPKAQKVVEVVLKRNFIRDFLRDSSKITLTFQRSVEKRNEIYKLIGPGVCFGSNFVPVVFGMAANCANGLR